MSRQILEQHISYQPDGTYNARVEVQENGERASLSDNFKSFDEANGWVIDVESSLVEIPDVIKGQEPAASEMTPEDAHQLNSQVVPAPSSESASAVPNGEQLGADTTTSAADTQTPPTDTTTSNEVAGAQDANAKPSDSAQQPDSAVGQGSDMAAAEKGSADTSTSDSKDTTTDNNSESKDDAGTSKASKKASSKSN